MSFTPSANLADQIAQHLSNRIIHAEFKPGERIIEDKLARELGVSRSPLREALRMLEMDGLVELMPRHGVRVTPLTRNQVACMYDILTELYSLLARKLFECVTEEYASRVDAAIGEMERCARDHNIDGYYTALFAFGSVALECVQIPMLERMINELWPSKRRVEYSITAIRRNDLEQNVDYFRQAYNHVLAGDIERAVQAVRSYTQGEKEFALAHMHLES